MPDLSFYPESELAKMAFDDPSSFGKSHKKEIKQLLRIADLSLLSFSTAQKPLSKALNSSNPIERYWALTVCSTFGKKAAVFYDQAKQICEQDQHPLLKARAALFLALLQKGNPVPILQNALAEATSSTEAAEILNMIVLLRDHHNYSFDLTSELVNKDFLSDRNIKWRFNYLMNTELD